MNNSFIINEKEEEKDGKELLRQKENELLTLLTALEETQQVPSWKILSDLLFEPLTERLTRELMVEAQKLELNTNRINQLQGELKWSKRFSRLEDLEKFFKTQLKGIRIKLYDKPDDGASNRS